MWGKKGIILTVDGWTMHNTSIPEYRKSGLETFKRLKKNHPRNKWEFREYMAAIHKSKDNICTDWSEEGGWSIWYQ